MQDAPYGLWDGKRSYVRRRRWPPLLRRVRQGNLRLWRNKPGKSSHCSVWFYIAQRLEAGRGNGRRRLSRSDRGERAVAFDLGHRRERTHATVESRQVAVFVGEEGRELRHAISIKTGGDDPGVVGS